MTNQYFTYDNIDLWDVEKWKDRISSVFPLVVSIGENEKQDDTPYGHPYQGLTGDDVRKFPFYSAKTGSADIPEVVDYWKSKGVYYESRAQGGVSWLISAPVSCLEDYSKKLPSIVVPCRCDLTDPYFAMKVMEKYKAYNEMVGETQDVIIVYLCYSAPDTNRIYVNILQEAYVFVPGDSKRVFLDVSALTNAGRKLSDVEGFVYRDNDGKEVDPDAAVMLYGSAKAPVLDVSGRWENRTSLSRDQISMDNWSNKNFDLPALIHTETGREVIEGVELEYRFDTTYDPEFVAYWDKKGVLYEHHELQYRRWKSVVPKSAMEHPEVKLPVICVFQEVNCANEHLAVTESSYFYEYFRIAAQGECILINFVLEDPEGNELLTDILEEAEKLYPIDKTRVYLAGHSHNGFYAQEYAARHPELVTAVAAYGDEPGLIDRPLMHVDDARIAAMKKVDIPMIVLDGYTESGCHFPYNQAPSANRKPQRSDITASAQIRYKAWCQRLDQFNCAPVTFEQFEAASESSEYAERMLGIPGDRAETLWVDGRELYVVDLKNAEGKYHLRIVGEQNMPHNTSPAQQKVSWSFLRRFAKDPETGKTVEIR